MLFLEIELRFLFGSHLTLAVVLIQENKMIAVLPISRGFLGQQGNAHVQRPIIRKNC